MLKKFYLSLLLAGFSLVPHALGNGGGYNSPEGGSGGNVLPFVLEGVSHIAMEEEDLVIELWSTCADIHVTYKLRNTTDSPVSVRFGFPVETQSNPDTHNAESIADSSGHLPVNPVLSYKACLNGKELPNELQLQSVPLEEDKTSNLCLYGWLVSTMELQAHETAELTIETRMKHIKGSDFTVSENNTIVPRNMVYRLSTAAVWNGPIKRGNITIKARSVDTDEVVFKSPVNRFKRSGHGWNWQFENLEPGLKDDIILQVLPEMGSHYQWDDFNNDWEQTTNSAYIFNRLGNWYRGLDIGSAKITVSSMANKAVKLNKAFNLLFAPGNSRTWVSESMSPEREESLTITLPEPTRVGAISLYPGVFKSNHHDDEKDDSSYRDYDRIETMQIIANGGTWSRPVRFESNEEPLNRWISLNDCPEKISSLKLVIKSVYPGKKGLKQTGISNLKLYRKLAQKPHLQPCR